MFAGAETGELCPFCRTPPSDSDEEEIKRLHKLEKGNPLACNNLGKLGCAPFIICWLNQDTISVKLIVTIYNRKEEVSTMTLR